MRVLHHRVLLLMLLTAAGAGCVEVRAQVPTGSIVGTVRDAQGLAIVGATVTLTNQGTSQPLHQTTGSLGNYQFSQMSFGLYRLEVSSPGFKVSAVTDIKLDASTEYSVPPVVLEVGAIEQTVSVEAGADLVRTTGAELTETVERQQIENFPILDRNPLNLLALEAGVAQNHRSGETVINGQRQSFSNVTLDGINIQDNYIRSNSLDYTPNLLLMSQTGEFTVTTQNAGPQAGIGSSQVSIVTPSGTNNWHGEGLWYYRSGAWAANEWFNNLNGVPKPGLLQNQVGGDIGGPLVKNKLFVYGAYELVRTRQQTPINTTVLTPMARNGYFRWSNAPGDCAQIVVVPGAPAHPECTAVSNVGGVPPVADSTMLSLLSRVPSTINNFGFGDGLNTGGYTFNQRTNSTRDNASIHVDWIPAAHHSFSATYAWNRLLLDRPGSGLGLADTYSPIPAVSNDDKENFVSVAWRWSPNFHFTNEVRFGFDLAPISFVTSQQFGASTISGTLFNNPNQNGFPSDRRTHTWSWQDNASWTKGNHALAFGIQVQRVTIFAENFINTIPNLLIDDTYSAYALGGSNFPSAISDNYVTTANSLLSSLAGIISQDSQTFNVTSRISGYVPGAPMAQNFRYNNWSLYAGDSWKIRRNLTLTYGLRWEYNSPFDERDGLIVLPVVPGGQTIQQTLNSDATFDFFGGSSRHLPYRKDLNNFAPNVGIAWDPFGNGKTSIRAGYSINYVNDELVSGPYNAALSNPGVSTQNLNSQFDGRVSSPPPIAVPAVLVPSTISGNLANLGGFPGGNFAYGIDPNLKSPYVQQWNLSVQREIGGNTSLTVSYIGNHGSKLYRAIDVNQIMINDRGFLNEFKIARNNGFLALASPLVGFFDPSYNKDVSGSQPLPLFDNNILFQGLLFFPNVQTLIQQGEIGELADFYHQYGNVYDYSLPSGQTPLQFSPNPLIEAADLLGNYSSSTYHAGSIQIRRRFRRGLNFQASYTFSKVFTDFSADTNVGVERFLPYLDNANPGLEKARANFDLTHAFKANFVYELPVGKGHMWSPGNSVLSQVVSGWKIASIFTWQSGAPFSILSGRGTLNRDFRSATTNTAFTTSSVPQIASQLGVRESSNGQVLLINPAFIGPDGRGAPVDALTCTPLTTGGFCNPNPGTVGNLPRNAFNGPTFFNMDLGLVKTFPVSESKKFEYRVEMFNALNHPTFAVGNSLSPDMNINDPNFGVATTTASAARVIQMGLRFIF